MSAGERSRRPRAALAAVMVATSLAAAAPAGAVEAPLEVLPELTLPLVPADPGPSTDMVFATWNIAVARDDNYQLGGIAQKIKESGAKSIALQEVDRNAERSGRVDQAQELSNRTGMYGCYLTTVRFATGGTYGILILAKHRIVQCRAWYLYTGGQEQRGLLKIEFDQGGARVRAYDTHLDNGTDSTSASIRRTQVAQIRMVIDPAPKHTFIGCDCNADPGSSEMQAMRSDWNDPWYGTGENTYPAASPTRRIDYTYLGPRMTTTYRALFNRTGDHSDHRGVVTGVLFP